MTHATTFFLILISFGHCYLHSAAGQITPLLGSSALIIKWGISARKGLRTTMEDAHATTAYKKQNIYGVFDGHRGSAASAYAAEHLLPAIKKYGEEKAYALIDKQIESLDRSGTTAITARIKQLPNGSYQLTIAWAGDSRAVLVRKDCSIRFATRAHRPENLREKKRIELAGGSVYLDRTEYVSRVASPRTDVNGLGAARALGDADWSNEHVSPIPDIKVLTLEPYEDAFLLLACDGVWDFMNDELAAFIIAETIRENVEMKADVASEQDAYQSQEDGSDALSIMAARTVRDGAYLRASNDNISAVLLRFIWQDNPL